MKKIAMIFTAFILLFAFSSCAIGHIEDTNGDDTSLCHYTEEDLVSKVTSHVEFNAVSSNLGRSASYSAKKFSGVKSLMKISYTGGIKLTINSSITVNEGNFRAYVLCDGEIVADLLFGENQELVIEAPKRSYEIKIAGESADVSISLDYEIVEIID